MAQNGHHTFSSIALKQPNDTLVGNFWHVYYQYIESSVSLNEGIAFVFYFLFFFAFFLFTFCFGHGGGTGLGNFYRGKNIESKLSKE